LIYLRLQEISRCGFFDLMDRANKLTKLSDSLVSLNFNINWEAFRLDLNTLRQKDRKSSAGEKAFDIILMFKILVLHQLLKRDGIVASAAT
jgi:hypothetical protein